MQWRAQELAPENYMMYMDPSAFIPYWNGMQPGFDGFMPTYPGPMPYMGGYGVNPMDMAFGGVMPHDPFGGPGCMMPPYGGGLPQRDRKYGRREGSSTEPPILSLSAAEKKHKARVFPEHDSSYNKKRKTSEHPAVSNHRRERDCGGYSKHK